MSATMLPPLIPDNAPFTPAQRAWLNGFFAGLVSGKATGTGLADANGNGFPTNNSTAPIEVEDFPWHDSSLSMDERMDLAKDKPAPRQYMAAMAQLDCGACGYLCKTYGEAIANGSEKDLTRCTPGGSETAKKLKQLVSVLALNDSANKLNGTANGVHVNGSATSEKIGYSRQKPAPAKLLEVVKLNGAGSDKDTRQIVIDLSANGLEFTVGDSLGVYPQNCPELVDLILTRLQADPSQSVALLDGRQLTARATLIEHATISRVNDGVVSILANSAKTKSEADTLRGLLANDPEDFLCKSDLLDILEEFSSIQLPIEQLVQALPPLQPRLYSIASSLKAHPGQVHLTVGVVRYKQSARSRKGVCSTFLAERAVVGKELPVFIQASHGFRLPTDLSKPVIMVGPGTGIAPFRAFLQERIATNASGPNWLFFGDQRGATDFLYQDELQAAVKSGQLARLDTAFSRDQQHKVYVQDRMREQGAELYRWLEQGAYFYVCGDAKRMAPDVDQALIDVVAQHGQLSADAAKQYVRQLTKDKRYLRDVY